MTTKAIFTRCNDDIWVDVGKRLVNKYSWEIAYWLGYSELENLVSASFPGVIFHDLYDATRGNPADRFKQIELAPLDQDFLEEMAVHESIALKMMDRIDPGGAFAYQDRIDLYFSNLMYWRTVFNELQPDLVFFPTSPHHVHDYILYVLCLKAGIQTVILERTNIPGLMLAYEQFEKGSQDVQRTYQELLKNHVKQDVELRDASKEYLDRLNGSFSGAMPVHTREKRKKEAERKKLRNKIKRKLYNTVDFILKGPTKTYLKQNNKHVSISDISRLEWLKSRQQVYRTRSRLIKHYDRLSGKVDVDRQFIFVALQCQPERNTSPNGRVFAHQYLMVDLLAKLIPSDWQLYVKEHISQLTSYQWAERGRTCKFYDDLNAIPCVKLVSLDTTSFDLIDAARAVATVSGSVGFEAVVRGKPAMVFGHSWYAGCEGVFYTPSLDSCRRALSNIVSGMQIDSHKVRLFVQALEKAGFTGYTEKIYESVSVISREKNAESIACAVGDFANMHQSRRVARA